MKKTLFVMLVLILSLFISSTALGGVPEEFVGQWEGSTGDISLTFSVDAEGEGTYTFEQSGYTESYSFALSIESETFSVQIPTNNRLGIAACDGTYAYAGGILTLEVQTTFDGGRVFSYTVPCRRAEAGTDSGSGSSVFPVTIVVYGETYSFTGYTTAVGEDGNTLIKIRGQGIVFLKDPDGNNTAPVSAVFQAAGEEFELTVDSCILHDSVPIDALSTTPIENDMVFKMDSSANPEKITLLNIETGEIVISFDVEDEPQIADT